MAKHVCNLCGWLEKRLSKVFGPLLPDSREGDIVLDVTGCNEDQKKEILRYASDVRRFEIERFWQRSNFFWLFIAAAFVAYANLQTASPLLSLLVACFGLITSLAWSLQNRGGKYWQEAWEQKVKLVEIAVLGTNLFSNIEPLERKGIWSARRFSASRLAIAVSDFTVIIWIVLGTAAIVRDEKVLHPLWIVLAIVFTGFYAILVLCCSRSRLNPLRAE